MDDDDSDRQPATTAKRRCATRQGWLLAGALLAALAVNLLCNLLPGSAARESWQIAWRKLSNQGPATRFDAESTYFQSLPKTGSVYVHFVGFDARRRLDEEVVSRFVFLGNWALYPRRVYVTTRAVPINDVLGILAQNNEPTLGWLQEHGVTLIIQAVRQPDGEIVFGYHPVPTGGD